jgi:hypothetical protein
MIYIRVNPRHYLVSLLAMCVGCSSGGASDSPWGTWEAVVDTIGDTITVHTVGGNVWGDTMVLEPDLSIGVLEGPEEEMFGSVQSIAVTDSGEILVVDEQVPVIRRFGPGGRYLGDIGREGGGPGEYKRPASIRILPDGRIVLRDEGNGRINVYAPDGEPLTNWRLPSGGTFSTSRPLYVDTAGNTYTMVLLEVGADVTEWTYGLAKFTPEGEHSDTVRAPTWDFEPATVVARREGSSSSNSVPFTPSATWTFSPLGYAIGGVSTDYRIDHYRMNAPVLRIERDWTPVPVLAEEKAEREHRIIENFKRGFGSWRWNGPPIPDTKPPFGSIMVDDDGRTWVQIRQPGYEYRSEQEVREEEERTGRPQLRYREHLVFDVYDADGRFLGPVKAPDEFQSFPEPRVRGMTVWGVTADDLGVNRVVRFRIVPMHGEP